MGTLLQYYAGARKF